MGIWIQVEDTKGLGPAQVFVGSTLGDPTNVERKIRTAGFPPEVITKAGNKEVTVKQISSGKSFSVGTLKVTQ